MSKRKKSVKLPTMPKSARLISPQALGSLEAAKATIDLHLQYWQQCYGFAARAHNALIDEVQACRAAKRRRKK